LTESAIVLAVMPDNEDAIVARGDALQATGKLDEAIKTYTRLTEIQPHYP
jgi:hypothetical protein